MEAIEILITNDHHHNIRTIATNQMNTTTNKILVVDDDPDIGMMIKTMLEYHGFVVEVTEQADKVESIISDKHFDLIIMDMLLSGMNGTDLCTQLKQHRPVPIVMMSAHPNAKELCLNAGADDFISKPFDMQELIRKISQFATAVKRTV